jgi:hypothetical protein
MLAATGCGENIDLGDNAGGGAGTSSAGGGGSTGTGTGTGSIAIHMRASTATFPHSDGLTGQTPLAHTSGIRSLQLFESVDDTDPLTVFDFGEESMEVSYADGADTLVYTADVADLPRKTFTRARVVHSHVRYRVTSTMHASGLDLPGEFDNLQVLSDGTLIDGRLRDHGYFEYEFEAGTQTFPLSGNDAPVPEWSGVGGFSVELEDGEWAYYFPVNLPVDPDLDTDVKVVLLVNMHESFRWTDEDSADFTAGVFDTTPTTFEPVLKFGANSFELAIE